MPRRTVRVNIRQKKRAKIRHLLLCFLAARRQTTVFSSATIARSFNHAIVVGELGQSLADPDQARRTLIECSMQRSPSGWQVVHLLPPTSQNSLISSGSKNPPGRKSPRGDCVPHHRHARRKIAATNAYGCFRGSRVRWRTAGKGRPPSRPRAVPSDLRTTCCRAECTVASGVDGGAADP